LRVKIAPSILAADQSDLKTEVRRVEEAGADMIHIDVADGHFAPNITLGPDTVKALGRVTHLPLDVHLMIDEPGKFISSFLEAGSDILTIHAEVVNERTLETLSRAVREKGKKIGLAVKPGTALPSWLKSQADNLDSVLILSVNPGFAGQQFIPTVLPKVERAIEAFGKRSLDVEVDGGVDTKNAAEIVKAGATVLVAGASIFRRGNAKLALMEMRAVAEGKVKEVSA